MPRLLDNSRPHQPALRSSGGCRAVARKREGGLCIAQLRLGKPKPAGRRRAGYRELRLGKPKYEGRRRPGCRERQIGEPALGALALFLMSR